MKRLSRRQLTGGLLVGLGGAFLLGCSSAMSSTSNGNRGSSGTEGDGDGDGANGEDGRDAGGSSIEGGGSDAAKKPAADQWASGGTAAMLDKATYPDPFATAGAACLLVTGATAGPCTEAADRVREDISEGFSGLPMRLALRFVDSDCQPIANAKVKIWHTSVAGSYSGNTPNNAFCLKQQADSAKHYFRGVQTTDAQGRVFFDSCFPGWYPSRCIHIHYTVTAGNRTFTSQVIFEQSLVTEIFSTHDDYKPFGEPDTTNGADGVVGNASLQTYVVKAERMSDGAMLASKELTVFNA